jgi:hypothetical protein
LDQKRSNNSLCEDEAAGTTNANNEGWFSNREDDEPVGREGLAAAAADAPAPAVPVKVYDSGATYHLSPYCEDFMSMRDIAPCPFNVANGGSFLATGMGDMSIAVPNDRLESELRLKDVLFPPNLAYTLVSIGQLDAAGFTVEFGDELCTISNPDGNIIGQVPHERGLYRVIHGTNSINIAVDTISLEALHCQLGHISHDAACKMVEKGLVTGIKLNGDTAIAFCQSCMYGKAVCKAVPCVCQGERATEPGGEVHTNVWGPAPVELLGGRRYYVLFTDDKT